MMIRLPEFDLLRDNWGRAAAKNITSLINLLSTFIMRYPGAAGPLSPQRLCRAAAAPHVKEDSIAGLLLKAMDAAADAHSRS
jgi:RNase E specificity factor CsrD